MLNRSESRRLLAALRRLHISRVAVAEQAKVHPSMVSKVLHRRAVSAPVLDVIQEMVRRAGLATR